jgi:hypothetical protein
LEELLSIAQYVDRYRLGARWRLWHDHQTVDEAGRLVGYLNLDQIGRTLAPVLLPRRKFEVLKQLPPRVENTVFVAMTHEPQAHHDENGASVNCIVSRRRKTGCLSDADQRRLICCLQNMRMSCNSTYLLDHKTDYGAKIDVVTLLAESRATARSQVHCEKNAPVGGLRKETPQRCGIGHVRRLQKFNGNAMDPPTLLSIQQDWV